MTPAHQGFEADDLPVLEVQARLVMQFQLIATQGPAQLAFEVGHAAGIAVDAFVEDVKGAALGALGLLHGDVRVPHQRVGAGLGPGVGDTQAGTDQQAFAVDPVRFGQRFGDSFGHPFGALGRAAGVDQQGEFIAAQARQLIAGFELAFQPRDHLQDQPVAGLMAEGVVGVTEVVEVEVTEGQAAAFVFRQPRGQQGLETLAVGDAGQRVLFGQALQGVFQHAALAHMAQATAQHAGVEHDRAPTSRSHHRAATAAHARAAIPSADCNGPARAEVPGSSTTPRCGCHRTDVLTDSQLGALISTAELPIGARHSRNNAAHAGSSASSSKRKGSTGVDKLAP